MFRYKSIKQTLFVAALIIILCLICLSGATYALFTSNANDGTIGVVALAGNVKVAIVDDISGESLLDKTLEIPPRPGEEKVLFEPGAAFYTNGFKIKNMGDVKVNYRVFVSQDPTKDMTAFNKGFEVYITTNPSDPERMLTLPEFEGTLEAGDSIESETYYLYIKMKESANDDFQDGEYSGIGVTVYAVQGNVEIGEVEDEQFD